MLEDRLKEKKFFFEDFTYLLLKRRRGTEKKRERNIDVTKKHQSVASHTCPDWERTCNPGTSPDQESNW